jgi:hypothetical protein
MDDDTPYLSPLEAELLQCRAEVMAIQILLSEGNLTRAREQAKIASSLIGSLYEAVHYGTIEK